MSPLPLSHGGNTGSNPVGDANKIKELDQKLSSAETISVSFREYPRRSSRTKWERPHPCVLVHAQTTNQIAENLALAGAACCVEGRDELQLAEIPSSDPRGKPADLF